MTGRVKSKVENRKQTVFSNLYLCKYLCPFCHDYKINFNFNLVLCHCIYCITENFWWELKNHVFNDGCPCILRVANRYFLLRVYHLNFGSKHFSCLHFSQRHWMVLVLVWKVGQWAYKKLSRFREHLELQEVSNLCMLSVPQFPSQQNKDGNGTSWWLPIT